MSYTDIEKSILETLTKFFSKKENRHTKLVYVLTAVYMLLFAYGLWFRNNYFIALAAILSLVAATLSFIGRK